MCVGIVPCQIYIIDSVHTDEPINALPGGLIRAGFITTSVPVTPHARLSQTLLHASYRPHKILSDPNPSWTRMFFGFCQAKHSLRLVFFPFGVKDGPDDESGLK